MLRRLHGAALTAAVSLSLFACAPPPEPAKLAAPASGPSQSPAATLSAGEIASLTQKVDAELDDLHAAAASADETRYFGHYAANAVFLGTDAKERWDMTAFRAFAHPHFAAGKGWSYKSLRRAVSFTGDGTIAYFDEDLANDRIGPTRGSGILVRDNGRYLLVQYNLALTVPNERVSAVHAAILETKEPPVDVRARYKGTYDKATEASAAGDLGTAKTLLSALVPDAKAKPDDDLEFWLHNELTWIAWANADLLGALSEVDAAKLAVEHSTLTEDRKNKLRLHEKWDRAYVLLELALMQPKAAGSVTMPQANAAKADYDTLAKRENDHDGAAVLEAFFAMRTGNTRVAVSAAKRVDVEKDSDVQDLYVIVRSLEMSADKADKEKATSVHARICSANSYLMKPLIVAQRKKEGHACP